MFKILLTNTHMQQVVFCSLSHPFTRWRIRSRILFILPQLRCHVVYSTLSTVLTNHLVVLCSSTVVIDLHVIMTSDHLQHHSLYLTYVLLLLSLILYLTCM